MAFSRVVPALFAAAAIAGCTATEEAPYSPPPGLPAVTGEPVVAFAQRHVEVSVGGGAAAQPRQCYFVHYTGWLTDGSQFDSSRDTSEGQTSTPFAFPQGARRVIVGWDVGFEGMRVGGKRRLFIPYQLAYGERGRPPVIPPRSELIFDVELMAVADTLPRPAAEPAPARSAAPRCPSWADASARAS